jgi:hypothetical protein
LLLFFQEKKRSLRRSLKVLILVFNEIQDAAKHGFGADLMNWGARSMKNKYVKLGLFNLCLCLAFVVVFSRAFLSVSIAGGGAFASAFGITVIVVGFALFFRVNYILLFSDPPRAEKIIKRDEINTLDDCDAAIRRYIETGGKTFRARLDDLLSQTGRMRKREAALESVLLEKFTETEISCQKFLAAVSGVKNVMTENIRNVVNRISAFDEDEYAESLNNQDSLLSRERRVIFDEYAGMVRNAVENNEELLLRIDKLTLELSRLNGEELERVLELDAVKEIDSLISDAKWYK